MGALFEKDWGHFIWLIIILASAAGQDLRSYIDWINDGDIIIIGPSGAIMGLFGAKVAAPKVPDDVMKQPSQLKIISDPSYV